MENEENWFDDKKLEFNNKNMGFLKEIARWTKFLSVVGFVGIGLMVVVGIFGGTMLSTANAYGGVAGRGMSPIFFTIMYLLMAGLYFMPVRYMWLFSSKMDAGLKSKIQSEVDAALENLKSHFKYIGIMMIVVLSIYALIFVIGIIGYLVASM